MNNLNQEALQEFPHEKLAAYTITLEQDIATKSLFLGQVRQEWNRREQMGLIPEEKTTTQE